MTVIKFKNDRQLRIAWSIVFVANLPVPPLLLVSMVTDLGARAGMLVTSVFIITPIYLSGLKTCRRFPGLGSVLITGGVFIALLQLWPVPHVLAILWSAEICDAGLTDGHNTTGSFGGPMTVGPLAGSLVVLLTTAFLFVTAIVIGLFLHLLIMVGRWMPIREPAHRPTRLRLWRSGRGFSGRTESDAIIGDELSG
jgi:hypothetical protein